MQDARNGDGYIARRKTLTRLVDAAPKSNETPSQDSFPMSSKVSTIAGWISATIVLSKANKKRELSIADITKAHLQPLTARRDDTSASKSYCLTLMLSKVFRLGSRSTLEIASSIVSGGVLSRLEIGSLKSRALGAFISHRYPSSSLRKSVECRCTVNLILV